MRQSCAVWTNLQINHDKFYICGLRIGTLKEICGVHTVLE
jgi:hypothetical protein